MQPEEGMAVVRSVRLREGWMVLCFWTVDRIPGVCDPLSNAVSCWRRWKC